MEERPNQSDDITRKIISSSYISENLHNFFPDSVFLDRNYNIIAISTEISLRFGYLSDELQGKSLSVLRDADLLSWLSSRLVSGLFANERLTITLKSGQEVELLVSGFYLGILEPSCNLIIIRFDQRDEARDLNLKLKETRTHIDNFIYRTAHDLRGPLATIQGLVYLLNMREDDKEVNNFISMINVNCKKLDERLTHLVYLAKAEEEFKLPSFQLRVSELETALRRTVERNSFVDYLKLWVFSSHEVIEGYNEVLTLSLINNLLMYVLSLPLNMHANIYVEFSQGNKLRIRLRAVGFEKDPKIEQVMLDPDASHYVDALKTSNFTYLYAALKIATHMKAIITYYHTDRVTQEIYVSIPKERDTLSGQSKKYPG